MEDAIDELVVGDGGNDSRRLTTSSHPNESIADVREFAQMWALGVDPSERVDEVRLS